MKSFRGSLLVAAMLACASMAALSSCATAPTQTQKDLTDDAVNIAVAVVIQGDSNDAAVWQAHAVEVVTIVEKLEGVAALDTTTLPALSAALGPLLDKANLKPIERLAANRLVVRLSNEIKRRVASDSVEVVEIRRVLAEVKAAASIYLPK